MRRGMERERIWAGAAVIAAARSGAAARR